MLLALLVLAAAAKGAAVPAPAAERLPELAAAFARTLEGRSVALPDGGTLPLREVLTEERLRTCLATIGEADAWPSAWLVVQDAARPFDLVLTVRLGESGALQPPATAFAVARREWDPEALAAVVREATGSKPPRERELELVVQGFSSKTVTTYQYETPADPKTVGGLAALLPAGTLVREAHAVDLGDGKRHTLALTLQAATFQPSDCSSCAGRLFGHADSGRVFVVLAGEQALEAELEITSQLRGRAGTPLVPRYACEPGDEESSARHESIAERFGKRELRRLLSLEDLDGDGRALEFVLAASFESCARTQHLVVGIDPATRRLRVLTDLSG